MDEGIIGAVRELEQQRAILVEMLGSRAAEYAREIALLKEHIKRIEAEKIKESDI